MKYQLPAVSIVLSADNANANANEIRLEVQIEYVYDSIRYPCRGFAVDGSINGSTRPPKDNQPTTSTTSEHSTRQHCSILMKTSESCDRAHLTPKRRRCGTGSRTTTKIRRCRGTSSSAPATRWHLVKPTTIGSFRVHHTPHTTPKTKTRKVSFAQSYYIVVFNGTVNTRYGHVGLFFDTQKTSAILVEREGGKEEERKGLSKTLLLYLPSLLSSRICSKLKGTSNECGRTPSPAFPDSLSFKVA